MNVITYENVSTLDSSLNSKRAGPVEFLQKTYLRVRHGVELKDERMKKVDEIAGK